jgi:hypothetical protein
MSDVMRAYGMYCGDLTPKEIAALASKGVHPDAIGWGDGQRKQFAVKAATVKWEGELWFDFAGVDGKRAAIIVCLDDQSQPADLAAWSPVDDRVGLCWGNVAMIGQEQALLPRLDGSKLWVHASPLDWLMHRRAGVVIVNHDAARPMLVAASPITVKTAALRATLDDKWKAPRVQVFDVGIAEATIDGGVS